MRKETDLKITEEGRDKGKVFHLTEMPAMKAEKWATKALMKLLKGNPDIGDLNQLKQRGMQGMMLMGMEALMGLEYDEIEPLLDELLSCVMITNPGGGWRTPLPDDYEEVSTLLQIKWAVFNLHVNFSVSASPLNSKTSETSSEAPSPNTATSPQPSPRFSPSARIKRRP